MDHTHDQKSEIKIFDEAVMSALTAEGHKVRLLQNDLLKTLDDLHRERENLVLQRRGFDKQIKTVETQMEKEIGSQAVSLKSDLQNALEERDDFMQLKIVSQYIEQAKQIGNELFVASEKKKKNDDKFGEDASLFSLEKEIQQILNEWFDRKDTKVKFEKEDYDIVINGRPRKSFGKGYRSIYRTAFYIGFANYCIRERLPHTGFVVIDSPLTTHGEADDKVEEGIQSAIFDYFANQKLLQLIVIDNKDPKVEVRKKVKYIHFSGVPGSSNQGFLPENKSKKPKKSK